MNYNKLPADVKEAYEAEKNSTEKGKCKRTNAIVNAIVPKDATYSSTISLEKKTFEVFRQVVCNKKEEDLERGYTFTEITGTGKLGSADKLNEGISRGDVVVKKNRHGKEMYYMNYHMTGRTVDDTSGGSIRGQSDQMGDGDFRYFLNCDVDNINIEWCKFALSGCSSKQNQQGPATEKQMSALQDASDACTTKLKSCRKLAHSLAHMSGGSKNVENALNDGKDYIKALAKDCDAIDEFLYSTADQLKYSEVQTALQKAAESLKKVLHLEKELQALSRANTRFADNANSD